MNEILHRLWIGAAVPLFHPFSPSERIYWLYMVSSYLLAFFVFLLDASLRTGGRGGFWGYAFPKSVYLHPSAVLDYAYFLVYKMFFFLIVVPFLITDDSVRNFFSGAFGKIHAPLALAAPPGAAATVLYSLAAFMVADFGIFLAHYLQHKVPVLWEFHKVHHSAEVLTPITVYRMHPVDDILTATLVSAFAGGFDAAWNFVFQGGSHPAMLMGVNLFTFGYYLFGYNLRHSHVWLSYGPAVSRVFISPAQHQIHHSAAKEHVDKNIGFVFSFWDMAAGTLCIPDRKMDIQFGLRHGEEKEYNSLARLFFLPFVKTARLFTKRRSAV